MALFILLTMNITSNDSSITAEKGVILHGYVKDAENETPISGATVQINGIKAMTDSRGFYKLQHLKTGVLKAKVSANGYAPHSEEFEILYNGKYRKDFHLTRNRVRLIISVLDDYSLKPIRVRVKIDGKTFQNDETGVVIANVKEGNHRIEIIPLSNMYQKKTLDIYASGKTQVEKITLIPARINLGDLRFKSGSSELEEQGKEKLVMVCDILKKYPQAQVTVEGHTDTRGSAEYNLRLSKRRAESVKKWLVEHGCTSPEKIKAIGYGESRPIVYPEKKPEDYAKNRRVIIRLNMP